MKSCLIATDRKTGKSVLLVGPEVEFAKQLAAYKKFETLVSDTFSDARLVELVDIKKPLNLKIQTKSKP